MNLFDIFALRLFGGSSSLWLDAVAWQVSGRFSWLPFYVAMLWMLWQGKDKRRIIILMAVLGLAVLIADQVASGVFKPLIARYRPAQEPRLFPTIDIVGGYRGGLYGFFSSHAANTVAVATVLWAWWQHKGIHICLAVWCVLNCWSRLYLGVHYMTDLMVGAAFGLLVGFVLRKISIRWLGDFRSETMTRDASCAIENAFICNCILLLIPFTLLY